MINMFQWATRIAGLCALVLGALVWLGVLPRALAVHMTLGGIVAVVLAILALTALTERVRIPLAIVGLAWAGATVYVGTLQDWWVAAGNHWLIELIHPLLGIGAIGLAEALGAAITRKRGSLRS